MAIIKGNAQWASIIRPNTRWEPHKYTITVSDLTEATVKELEDLGLERLVKYDKPYSPHIKISTYVKNAKTGEDNPKPLCVGPDGVTEFTDWIGNGSEVRVMFIVYNNKRYGSVNTILEGVQVVEHVPYEETEKSSSGSGDSFV